MRLSANELASLAVLGWTDPADREIAVAVALAESGGETYAIGQNKVSDKKSSGSQDLGLWQINNYFHGPKLRATPAWRDPWVATSLARRVWSEGGWRLWATYLPGKNADGTERPASYLAHMPAARIGLMMPHPPPGLPDTAALGRLGLFP